MGIELPPEYQRSGDEEFMNSRQVAYFGRRLEESRVDPQKELAAIQPSEADGSSRVGDQTDDHASAESERGFMIQNGECVQMLLRRTERAIARLENRTYGYCVDTSEPISLNRLMVQPTTSLSLAAQEARERRGS
jgi:DnaK suppressor protein